MRPASQTNLSFHSSSDCSVRPIYLDEGMSAGSLNRTGTGMDNSTVTPLNSEAFATARSAGGTTPGGYGVTPPVSARQPPPTVSTARGEGTALAAPPRTTSLMPRDLGKPPLSGRNAESTELESRYPATGPKKSSLAAPHPPLSRQPSYALKLQPASCVLASPQPDFSVANTTQDSGVPDMSPVESPKPQPPSALPRRARKPAVMAGQSAAASDQAPTSAQKAAAKRGWWSSALQALRNHRDQASSLLDGMLDPDSAVTAVATAPMTSESGGGAGSNHTPSSGFDGLFDDLGHSPYHEVDEGDPLNDAERSSNGARRPPRPRHQPPRHLKGYGSGLGVRTERVRVRPGNAPFGLMPPMARPIPEITEEELLLNEAVDVDEEPPTIEVDLVSALHSYCDNPNEAYGHLVAAALSSRSKQRPVTGEEIAEARHNPFLVRLIVDSDCLNCDDPLAQGNVQDTLDSLIPDEYTEVTPALFEYLESFFRMPFVKLSHERYALLKSSGFENIGLMHHHPHVLPDEKFHSIIFNYSDSMWVFNLILMILSLMATMCCTVSTALVLADWMTVNDNMYQSYGFYTLIAYGCGYALHLIFMIFFMRTKENEQLYENTHGLTVPSAYCNVCPVLPVFEVFCLATFIRTRRTPRMIAFTHNVLVASRLAACCYAFCFGFPQYVVQSYFNHTSRVIDPRYLRRWPFYMIMVTALVQWAIALFRFGWMVFTYDSTSALGFACFNIRRIHHSIERHRAIPKLMIYVIVYVLECGVYIIVASGIELGNMEDCIYLPTCVISVSGVTLLVILILYIMLVFKADSIVGISFVSIPVCLLVVTILLFGSVPNDHACYVFERVIFHESFVFGYIAYAAFLTSFLFWLVMLLCVFLLKVCRVDVFPRFKRPLVRSVKERSPSSDSVSDAARVKTAEDEEGKTAQPREAERET